MTNLATDLRRVRDFGEIINDSFAFFKAHFKTLFKPLIIICGFFMAVTCVSHIFLQINVIDMARAGYRPPPGKIWYRLSEQFSQLGFHYLCVYFFALTKQITILSYIRIWQDKKGLEKPTLKEVWGYFEYYFLRSLGSVILLLILFFIGCIFCVLPGIYLIIVFHLFLPVMIFENASFTYSFNRIFRLISGNWWFTCGIIFIMLLIGSVAGSVASVPMGLISSLRLFVYLKSFTIPVVVVLSILLYAIMLVNIFLNIAMALCYFSFTEQKEGTGLLNRIEKLGNNDQDITNLPTEQY